MRSEALPALTEAQWMRQVVDLAAWFRWAHYHPYLSIRSARGWPDLALVRPPRVVLAELKSDKGKVTDSQAHWIALLEECPGVEVYVWRPTDVDKVMEVLR